MGIFSIFKKRKSTPDVVLDDHVAGSIADLQCDDFLGKAAEAGHKAKAAVKAKKYHEAWKLYHDQKSLYMQHANKFGFTARQTIALDASVHEDMANILRHENKHEEALVHIVYWVLAGNDRPLKRHQQKLKSYFNRCKFKKTTLSEAQRAIQLQSKMAEFKRASSSVAGWISRG
ncbi:hypothetical protein Q4485_14220 [Granulosicoccaceae sp. 1_MG-2023]|nr:hypothetical protein [Granulosicoccaceae sp. 1_MG-2023]